MGKFIAEVDNHLVLPARVRLTSGTEKMRQLLGRSVPLAVDVRLIIDTGSKRSCLTPEVLNRLNVATGISVRIETTLSVLQSNLYWVRLEFADNALAGVPELAVARLPMPPLLKKFHGVVGRDLLSRWHSFVYEGRRARYSITDTPASWFRWLGW